jgi:hypothetical protein
VSVRWSISSPDLTGGEPDRDSFWTDGGADARLLWATSLRRLISSLAEEPSDRLGSIADWVSIGARQPCAKEPTSDATPVLELEKSKWLPAPLLSRRLTRGTVTPGGSGPLTTTLVCPVPFAWTS